ncbi:MAG: hypothetical protein HZC42_14405 [Candidatus Eisenbacteria bacterium]|nr:hypothetical protein [Candidatus Eisenbacteria bacterium]
MRRMLLMGVLLALVAASGQAAAQSFSARRMAMGGVVLAGGGPGSDASNVAYRAVSAAAGSGSGITLPFGLIPLIADPPELDPDQPDFNIYELANLLYNPPWNLQLVAPPAPSSDITIVVAKDRLAVDLGEVRDVFPRGHSRIGVVNGSPAIGFGIHRFFVAVAPLVHYENDLSLNDPLQRVIDGEEFRTLTQYAMLDHARGQAAAGVQLGWAGALAKRGDPRERGGSGLYAGARVKVLRGLAYADADNVVSFTTRDTLFAADPVDVHYTGHFRDTGPEGGRIGRGLDLGAVWLVGGLELGVGVNDVATRLDWRVRESIATSDSATGDYVQQVLARDQALTSSVPVTVTANAAARLGRFLVAADAVRGVNATLVHGGAEVWLGRVALRAGANLDANRMAQASGGAGVRFGRFGLDAAVATHSRNLSRERGVELGAGLAFYH